MAPTGDQSTSMQPRPPPPAHLAGTAVMPALAALGVLLLALLSNRDLVAELHKSLSVTDQEPDGACDAIIVLGYALHKSGEPMNPLRGRVQAAVAQLQKGTAPIAVLSGAHPGGGLRHVSEANAMYKHAQEYAYATGQRFDPEQWLQEEASTSTRENALYSLGIGKQRGWSCVALVTNPFHQRRSLLTFQRAAKDLGMPSVRVHVVRTPFVGHTGHRSPLMDALIDVWDYVRELAALAWYRARGFI